MKKLLVFDFDGTLTTRDTFLLFIRYACGEGAFLRGMLRYGLQLVLMKLRLLNNNKVKERVFSHFFRGWSEQRFTECGRSFARQYRHILRPDTVTILQKAQQEGNHVLICTASIVQWVQPFFPEVEVVGTEPETLQPLPASPKGRGAFTDSDAGARVLTGRFSTPNCYGLEKVRRLKEYLRNTDSVKAPLPFGEAERGCRDSAIIAYGDSRGDRELLAWADEGIMVK